MTDRIVIYHADCIDGATAAWVARHHDDWRDAEYLPARYGDNPPDVTGKDVLIVDFSYPRDVLLKMQAQAKSIRVIDHHKTAAAALQGLDFCVFDQNRSGAGITWDELFPSKPRPALVSYVEDRDLWRWKLPHSREINAYIGLFDASELDLVNANLGEPIDETVQCALIGHGALQQSQAYARAMCKYARRLRMAGHEIAVVNAGRVHISELLHALAADCAMAIGWHQDADGVYRYDLRSNGMIDVSAIATALGGGGHANAAGFESRLPFDDVLGDLVNALRAVTRGG